MVRKYTPRSSNPAIHKMVIDFCHKHKICTKCRGRWADSPARCCKKCVVVGRMYKKDRNHVEYYQKNRAQILKRTYTYRKEHIERYREACRRAYWKKKGYTDGRTSAEPVHKKRGRPPKYHTEEEKREARRGYAKKAKEVKKYKLSRKRSQIRSAVEKRKPLT